MKLYSLKLYTSDTLIRNFVPAKDAGGVVGMYDTVNNVFYENKGTGEFIAGDPVTDNSCRNLADMTEQNIMVGKYVSAEGIISDSEYNFTYMTFIPVKPNTTYTLSFSSPLYFASVSEYSTASDDGFITRQTKYSTSTTEPFDLTDFTFTTGATTNYIRWGSNMYKARAITLNDVLSLNYMFEEGDTATSYVPYCEKIKIATTKYNETKFSPLNTALQNAISVVDSVVSNTITQAGRIATLQAQKQTRPNDIADDSEKCPAGKKCLLVTDTSGVPHWYEIVTSILPDGYTELQYIESTGTQYIDTGFVSSREAKFGIKFRDTLFQEDKGFFGSSSWVNSLSFYSTTIRYCLNNTAFSLNITDATHSGELICSSAGVVGTLDGREVSFPQVTDSNRGSGNIYLFSGGRNRSGIEAKIDWFKIWDLSGTLVRNFVPAKNPDGKIGMYDTVSGTFFENQGTGDFIAGPVAE